VEFRLLGPLELVVIVEFPTISCTLTATVPAKAVMHANAATAVSPALFKNCDAVHRRCPHGIGTLTARAHTSGEPVTTFKRSSTLYNLARSYNRGLGVRLVRFVNCEISFAGAKPIHDRRFPRRRRADGWPR
jgi:hypothetical protein